MNTLFDESGVVVPYADDSLADLLRGFSWKQLFGQRRLELGRSMDFYLFGHGLYEKLLNPYVCLTGQGLVLKVESAFFDLPLLGIPGWTVENTQETYYDNTDYFRLGRQRRAQCTPLNTAPSSVAG